MENILLQQNDDKISAKVPTQLKANVLSASAALKINASQFIKIALIEKLEKLNTKN